MSEPKFLWITQLPEKNLFSSSDRLPIRHPGHGITAFVITTYHQRSLAHLLRNRCSPDSHQRHVAKSTSQMSSSPRHRQWLLFRVPTIAPPARDGYRLLSPRRASLVSSSFQTIPQPATGTQPRCSVSVFWNQYPCHGNCNLATSSFQTSNKFAAGLYMSRKLSPLVFAGFQSSYETCSGLTDPLPLPMTPS